MGYLLEEINTSVNSWSIDRFRRETELKSQTGASQKSAFSWQWFSGEAYSVWSLCHVYVNLQPQMWELQQARGNWKKTSVNEYSLVLRAKKEKVILGLFILDMKRRKGNIITSKYMKDCCKKNQPLFFIYLSDGTRHNMFKWKEESGQALVKWTF